MSSTPPTVYGETAVQKIARAVGLFCLFIGLSGFWPATTPSVEHIRAFGTGSEAYLLSFIQVSVLHNAIHLICGAVGIAAGDGVKASRMFLIWGGSAYFVLWLYGLLTVGLLTVGDDDLNIIPINEAGNWLNLGLASGMILLGMIVRPDLDHSLSVGTG